MFSPNMMRHIIDPDRELENYQENNFSVNKRLLNCNIDQHERILGDYSFFYRLMQKTGELFCFLFSPKQGATKNSIL